MMDEKTNLRIKEMVKMAIDCKGYIDAFWSDRWESGRSFERTGYPVIMMAKDAQKQPFAWLKRWRSSKNGAAATFDDFIKVKEEAEAELKQKVNML